MRLEQWLEVLAASCWEEAKRCEGREAGGDKRGPTRRAYSCITSVRGRGGWADKRPRATVQSGRANRTTLV